MDMEDDDFTFPTVAAARAPATEGQPGRGGGSGAASASSAPAASRPRTGGLALWPFAASVPPSPRTGVTTVDEEAPASSASGLGSNALADEDEEERRVAADDRMDMLWDGSAATTDPRSAGSQAHAAEPPPPPPKQQRRADAAEGAVADAERMDKLWESFNEELLLLRHRDRRSRPKSAAAAAAHHHQTGSLISLTPARPGLLDPDDDPADRWYLCNYHSPPASDDAESEDTCAWSPADAARRGYGCAPTMLRASSRAGGAAQFCARLGAAAQALPEALRRRQGGDVARTRRRHLPAMTIMHESNHHARS